MPNLTGLDIVSKLSDHKCTIPFVLCTGESNDELIKRVKHFKIDQLIEKIMPLESTFNQVFDFITNKFSLV